MFGSIVRGVIAASLLVVGCTKEEEPELPPAAAAEQAEAPEEVAPEPAEPEPMRGEALITRTKQCWADFDSENADVFSGCYTDTATSQVVDHYPAVVNTGKQDIISKGSAPFWAAFTMNHKPQTILTNGNQIAVITLTSATNDGAFGGQEATGKSIGMLTASFAEVDDAGNVTKDYHYYDQPTLAGQLGQLPEGQAFRAVLTESVAAPTEVVGSDSETETANIALVASWTEALNKGDEAAMTALIAEDAVMHGMDQPTDLTTGQAILDNVKMYRAAFSDLQAVTEQVFAAGDFVVSRVLYTGTNDGDLGAVKATGNKIELRALNISRVENGKFKETHGFANNLAMMVQLGLVEAPAAPAVEEVAPTAEAEVPAAAEGTPADELAPEAAEEVAN